MFWSATGAVINFCLLSTVEVYLWAWEIQIWEKMCSSGKTVALRSNLPVFVLYCKFANNLPRALQEPDHSVKEESFCLCGVSGTPFVLEGTRKCNRCDLGYGKRVASLR